MVGEHLGTVHCLVETHPGFVHCVIEVHLLIVHCSIGDEEGGTRLKTGTSADGVSCLCVE